MLHSIVRKHHERNRKLREDADAARKAAASQATVVSHLLVNGLNIQVANCFTVQRDIDKHAKNLSRQVTKFSKTVSDLVTVMSAFSLALKELGDVKHWATVMQRDLSVIVDTLADLNRTKPAASVSH